MPYYSVARMVEASKRFGLTVEVVPGAETRGSSAFNPYGFVGHHTAGAKTGDRPSLNLCVVGRSDLDGPLCNDFLTRAGVNVIVAAGRANHAGVGGFRGLVGNSAMWGCEAEDDGDGVWTDAQLTAYPRLVAARLWLINRDASWYCAHRTWAPTRKVDPTGISDDWMRQKVAPLLAAGSVPTAVKDADMPLTPADGQTVFNTKVEVPPQYQASYNLKVYTAEQMLFSAQYHAQESHRELATFVAASTAREGALLAALQHLTSAVAAGGLSLTRVDLQQMMEVAASNALTAAGIEGPPSVTPSVSTKMMGI